MTERTRDSILIRWIESHQGVLLRYLKALGADEAEALDVAQDVFVLALERGVEDQGDAAARRYLRTTARRHLVRTRRRAPRVVTLDEEIMDRVDDLFAALHDEQGTGMFDDALKRCLQELSPKARELVLRRHRDDLGRTELAKAVEMSEPAVKQGLRRARAALRACVGRRLGDALPRAWRATIADGDDEGANDE
ncbi:MAG: sigma-70 family RNA polymerase sigma factor [Planctomycetota bacterium]